MARKANLALRLEITADCLHAHDALYDRTWRTRTYLVESVTKRGPDVQIKLMHHDRTWVVPNTTLVAVQPEHECHCDGSGIHYISGSVVNGVFQGTTGTCFGCAGKGYQTRKDVIRNHTYWAKYARVGA